MVGDIEGKEIETDETIPSYSIFSLAYMAGTGVFALGSRGTSRTRKVVVDTKCVSSYEMRPASQGDLMCPLRSISLVMLVVLWPRN